MTREEAIKHLRNDWFMSLGGQLCVDEDKKDAFLEAVGMGIKALRPVSREQVEKVWRGEWINKHSAYDHKIFTCARCGKQISIQGENLNFCPACGAAQTDEAVDMVMERLEVLHDNRI